MSKTVTLVAFRLAGQRYALPSRSVIRIVRAVEVTPLPNAPEIILGVVNVAGTLVPIVDLRRRFVLPTREIFLTDQIIIANTQHRIVGLMIDASDGLIEADADVVVHSNEVLSQLPYVQGVLKLDDGLLLIHDLDRCLSLEEEQALSTALEDSM